MLFCRIERLSKVLTPLFGSAGDERFVGAPPTHVVGARSLTVQTLATHCTLIVAVFFVFDLVIVVVLDVVCL